ncbi:MAG: KH domain-containing protein [bacterium]|nr:KH domain-containing protein [bacterium]
MRELVEYIVRGLVDRPDEVRVTQVDGETSVLFELRCDAGDIGKVIGKSGRTIKAIRTILNAAAARDGARAMVEIVE